MTGDRSQLINFLQKFLGTVKFGNDHVVKIMGYGDYKIGNVTISRVYYVEGLGHNLFSVGQFCNSDLEVAFRQHTCFIRNLEGVDLLTESVNGKKYILVIVDDYSRFTWVKFLCSKDETPMFIQVSENDPGAVKCSSPTVDNQNAKFIAPIAEVIPQVDDDSTGLCYPTNDGENVEQFRTRTSRYDSWNNQFRTRAKTFIFTSKNDWDLLFQPLFDELLNPPPSVDNQDAKVIAPIAEVIPQVDDDSTGSPSSTAVDQDAPSPSKSLTPTEIQSSVILQDVGNDNLDIEVAHMGNDTLLSVPITKVASGQSSSMASPQINVQPNHPMTYPNSKWTKDHPLNYIIEVAHIGNDPLLSSPITEVASGQSSSQESPQTNVQPNHPMTYPNSKWTKDHPLNYIIGPLSRPVSTRLQLYEQALFCYYDAFLTSVEPKTYKEALTQACWIEAMQEELQEFERLEVWELVPRPDKVMVPPLFINFIRQLFESL
nr:integrase, catalytic region, zinc finger, CCHC-type, peptidase aspartic, catalytic [Tanacetum cinerariifolium]